MEIIFFAGRRVEMKKGTVTHQKLEDVYEDLGVPEVGKLYKIDEGFKRIKRLWGIREVVVLSVTLTDVYVKFLSTGRQSNISHFFFKKYQENALNK